MQCLARGGAVDARLLVPFDAEEIEDEKMPMSDERVVTFTFFFDCRNCSSVFQPTVAYTVPLVEGL